MRPHGVTCVHTRNSVWGADCSSLQTTGESCGLQPASKSSRSVSLMWSGQWDGEAACWAARRPADSFKQLNPAFMHWFQGSFGMNYKMFSQLFWRKEYSCVGALCSVRYMCQVETHERLCVTEKTNHTTFNKLLLGWCEFKELICVFPGIY